MENLVKFRWHRGGLAESMATMVEDTPEKIRGLVRQQFPGEITSQFYTRDDRIGWDTHIVLSDGQAVGFANGDING